MSRVIRILNALSDHDANVDIAVGNEAPVDYKYIGEKKLAMITRFGSGKLINSITSKDLLYSLLSFHLPLSCITS